MKFKIKCAHTVEPDETWGEDYDKDILDAEEWAKETVAGFNQTLRPGERERMLLAVEVLDSDNAKFHEWIKRTDGMSISFRGRIADLVYCAKCGITGKRFGLSSTVFIDSKYRKKVFRRCDTAKEYLAAEILRRNK